MYLMNSAARDARRVAAALGLLALGLAARPAAARAQWSCPSVATAAQTCTFTPSVAMTVDNFSTVRITGLTGSTLPLRTRTLSGTDYVAGYIDAAAVTVRVWANRSWTATFTASAPTGTPTKSVNQFSWVRAASCPATGHTALAAGIANAIFASGTGAATPNAGSPQVLCFRTALSWTGDTPGTVTLPLSFTVSAP